MTERKIPSSTTLIVDGDFGQTSAEPSADSQLDLALSTVELDLDNYGSLFPSGALPMLVPNGAGVSRNAVIMVENILRTNGILKRDDADKRGYIYRKQDVLGLAAVCWLIGENHREGQPYKDSLRNIILNTKAVLGPGNPIAESLVEPADDDLEFSISSSRHREFINGRDKRSIYGPSASGSRDLKDTIRPSKDERAEEMRRWNLERLNDVLDIVPNSVNSMRFPEAVPEFVAETILKISAARRQSVYTGDLEQDLVSCLDFKRAVRDCIATLEDFQTNSNIDNLWMLYLEAVRRENRV